MEHDTKHKRIVLDYIKKSNLEIIVQNSIRSLIQTNSLPDNPYGAMTRHFTYFAAKDDLNRIQQQVKSFELKNCEPSGAFSVTNQQRELECFGLAHLLHYTSVDHFKILFKTLKELCLEHKRNYGPYNLEVRIAIGGGELFKSNLVPNAEVAPTPLEIRAECTVEGPKFENGFSLFADYVYEDIMRIGSNNALNLVRDFCVEQGPNSTYIKKVSLEQMQDNKQILINELKNATIQKRVSYIRVLVFSQDLERLNNKDLIRAVTPSRLIGVTEPSVLDHFQFISMKKYYVMHYVSPGPPAEVSTLSPVPCIGLYSCLFPNPSSARNYAGIFYLESENPYEIPALQEFQEFKRDRIVKYYRNSKTIKMIWEMLGLVLATKDHASNISIVNEIFCIFSHPSCKLYRIIRITRALIVLINCFYDTEFEHFKKLSEGLFVRLKEECWTAFGNASSAEMLILKPQVVRMLDCISVNKSRTLSIHPGTLRILDRIECISNIVAKNSTEMLLRHSGSLSEAYDRILQAHNIKPGMTHKDLFDKKQTDYAVDIDERLKSENLKRDSEYTIIYDYLVKSGVIDTLVLTTRDLIMSYPLLTNPLKTYAVKIMSGLFKFDMAQYSSTAILEQYLHVPSQIADDVYVHNNRDNKYNVDGLAYVVGYEEYLLVTSWEEIGFFRIIFVDYELDTKLFKSVLPVDYTMESVLGICGTSLVNSQALNKFPSLWHAYNDIFIVGPSFNAASHSFLDLLIKYALWLDNSTNASVVGFYTPYSETPLASFSNLISATERKNSIGLILSAFQMNSRVWIRFIIPYKGNENSQVTGIPIAVHLYFNMHFRISSTRQVTSLIPLNSLEDIVKVFYSKEDFELWKEIINIRSINIQEKLIDEMNNSFDCGQHYRGTVCLLFIKALQRDKNSISRLLRVNETPIKSIIEASRFAGVLIDVLLFSSQGHRKAQPQEDAIWGNKLKSYCQATFFQERNAILESAQIGVLKTADRFVSAISDINEPKYPKALSSLSYIYKYFKVAKLLSSLIIHDILQETKEFSN